MSYIDNDDICIATLLFMLITIHCHLAWYYEMAGMIIYLIYCLWLIYVPLAAKFSNNFMCDLIYDVDMHITVLPLYS